VVFQYFGRLPLSVKNKTKTVEYGFHSVVPLKSDILVIRRACSDALEPPRGLELLSFIL
jgi:hypothetical protein